MPIEHIAALLKVIIIPVIALQCVPILVWLERRGSAFIQNRLGPRRANIGPIRLLGLLHLAADALKFVFKETFRPAAAHPFYFYLAPALVLVPALMSLAVLPLADHIRVMGVELTMSITQLDYAVAYVFAVSSLSVLGITLAGWASNNKYSLLGGLRCTAQMISYEISLGLSLFGALLVFRSLDLNEIARAQGQLLFGVLPMWGVVVQPLGFLLFLVAAFAEANRLPFDLPEGDSELVAGYHTEYAGMKFLMFYMAEYVAMISLSGLIVTVFFGGWQVPWAPTPVLEGMLGQWGRLAAQLAAFAVKMACCLWFFIWIRWTLPRFRYDQLMALGWKAILPLSLINIVVTALVLLVVR
jgi:NADH-quinone oxidoreductase subunit H